MTEHAFRDGALIRSVRDGKIYRLVVVSDECIRLYAVDGSELIYRNPRALAGSYELIEETPAALFMSSVYSSDAMRRYRVIGE